VNGGLWHWHNCQQSRMESTNIIYLRTKIDRNVQIDKVDKVFIEVLGSDGWTVGVSQEWQLAESIVAAIQCLQLNAKWEASQV